MRASVDEEFKRRGESQKGKCSGTVVYLHSKVQSMGTLITMKLLGKMVKLSTDVQLPPKLPPSESDRKDQGSIKIGEICFSMGT